MLRLPNNPQSIRRNPLILFTNQALFPTNGKQLIKAIPGLGELASFEIQHGFELSLTFHSFLVGHRLTHKTHTGHHH